LVFRALADSGVQHKQAGVGIDDRVDLLDLGDQLLFEGVPTRGVDDVDFGVVGRFETVAGDLHRIVSVGIAVEVNLGVAGHLLGLIVRAGPKGVSLDDRWAQALLCKPPRHLGGGRRLS